MELYDGGDNDLLQEKLLIGFLLQESYFFGTTAREIKNVLVNISAPVHGALEITNLATYIYISFLLYNITEL